MTHEAKSEPAELVSPAPSVAPVSAAGPLWQQLLLSQAIAQNSAGLSSLPNSEAFRQPSAFQSFSQQSAAQALLQLPYQSRPSAPNGSANHLTGARRCGDVSAACKRKRNIKQQELNKLAQQRYRERKKERDAELHQVLEGQTARMVELLDNHQKLQARVKELEHQLREKQVENVYLRGEISGLKNNNSQSGHMLLDHDKESK
ncbi:hypothetical protein WJX79_007137 [Trebouxia sp. C0005]